MGVSRSGLFAMAMGDLLRQKQEEEILSQLNEVYSNGADAPDRDLVKRIKATVRRTVRDRQSARQCIA